MGRFQPNAFGLHDMHGNARQWLEDCWHTSYADAPTDGTAWTSDDCSHRVYRGGSWYGEPSDQRAAYRGGSTIVDRTNGIGLRVGRMLTP